MAEMIPKKMRALVLPVPGRFEIQEVSAPRPEVGEVLCKVRGDRVIKVVVEPNGTSRGRSIRGSNG